MDMNNINSLSSGMARIEAFVLQLYLTFQSMGSFPDDTSASFALLKHLDPKNGELVLVAPSGLD